MTSSTRCTIEGCSEEALRDGNSGLCKFHWLREGVIVPKAFTSDQLAALLIGAQMKIPRCEICPRFAVDYGSIAPHKPPEFSRSDTPFRAAYCDQHGEIDPHRFHGMQAIYDGRELAMRLNVTIWGEQ